MKIRSKVSILFIIISLFPIMVISIFTYNRYRKLIYDQIHEQSQNVFANAVGEANTRLENINNIRMLFTLYSDSHNAIINDLRKYNNKNTYTPYDIFESNNNIKFVCQSLIFSSSYINGIFIFTPSNVVLGYGYGGNIDVRSDYSPFEDTWYKDTLQKRGKIHVSPLTKKNFLIHSNPSISFSTALYDIYTKEFLGVLIIDCTPEVFDLSSVNTMSETTYLTITDNANNLLYSDSETTTSPQPEQKYDIMSSKLNISSLTLSSYTSYDALYRNFMNTFIILAFIILLCSLVAIILCLALSYYLTVPITNLTNHIAKFKMNTLLQDNKYLNRMDEVGVLYNEYNLMLQKLEDNIRTDYKNKLIVLDAQMRAFEAQINSHFLFNTLEAINSVAEIEEIESISTMSISLGNMFRYSIKTQSELVTIEEELHHVRDYISIQKIRFSNRFELITDISDSLLKLHILKLILQPIIENALYHGLKYCSCGDTITLHASMDEHNIYFTISDNGAGMPPEHLSHLLQLLKQPAKFQELGQRKKESIGLKNVHSRIQLYYGEHYGVHIESTMNVGTHIKITIPKLNHMEE